MKKSIKAIEQDANEQNYIEQDYEITEETPAEEEEDPSEFGSNFSLSGIISYLFVFILIGAVATKFIFPTISSFEANMTHKKIGKSIVANYFNLLENTKYADALKLLDTSTNTANMDTLLNSITNEFGDKVVDCNVVDVIENQDYSIVNTMISYVDNGQIVKKDKSLLVRDTPSGWKISLNGIIKKFKLEPSKVNFDGKYAITAQDIEYCIEGINISFKVENFTYRNISVKGTMTLSVTDGPYCPAELTALLKPRVKYKHNILFEGLTGQPNEMTVTCNTNPNETYRIPINIIQ